jgi:hypothetical protein
VPFAPWNHAFFRSLFRPLTQAFDKVGFSHGPVAYGCYAAEVRLAPQETRTNFVTAVTALSGNG